jgi:hypothetical protein
LCVEASRVFPDKISCSIVNAPGGGSGSKVMLEYDDGKKCLTFYYDTHQSGKKPSDKNREEFLRNQAKGIERSLAAK